MLTIPDEGLSGRIVVRSEFGPEGTVFVAFATPSIDDFCTVTEIPQEQVEGKDLPVKGFYWILGKMDDDEKANIPGAVDEVSAGTYWQESSCMHALVEKLNEYFSAFYKQEKRKSPTVVPR